MKNRNKKDTVRKALLAGLVLPALVLSACGASENGGELTGTTNITTGSGEDMSVITSETTALAIEPAADDLTKLEKLLENEPSSVMDKEKVTLARELVKSINELDDMEYKLPELKERLLKAEALVWAYETEDIYKLFKEKGPDENGAFAPGGGLWVWDSRYSAFTEEQKAVPEVVLAREHLSEVTAYEWGTFPEILRKEYTEAKRVEEIINVMDPTSAEDVGAARAAYDGLSEGAKARILNYEVLKKAEGTNDVIPPNLTSAGGRAWRQGDGITPAQYGEIGERMSGYFPDARVEFVWIAGMLVGKGIQINVDFNSIATDGKYTPDASKYPALTKEEWNSRFYINFTPQNGNKGTHEEYLDYFDQNDIYVYLQVESGFADMITLMDIYRDIFDIENHKSVLGFAVDVEWYYGITTDAGIPVSDGRAKEWAEYLYETWGEGKSGLVLKHYNETHLPLTYRGGEAGKSEKLIFCNDSQNVGSWDGSVGTFWDSDKTRAGSSTGLGRDFKTWADFYPDNKVLYQIGYSGDRQWIYGMDDPIIKSLSVKLAEASVSSPEQEVGIAWVNFTYKDPLTFGDIIAPSASEKTAQVMEMLNGLSSEGSVSADTLAGQRFDGKRSTESGGTGASYTDALLVAKLRELVNSLPQDSLDVLSTQITRLEELEPMALDIRIKALSAKGAPKAARDTDTARELLAVYEALDDAQKNAVLLAGELEVICEALGIAE